jgi:hypothetical protein
LVTVTCSDKVSLTTAFEPFGLVAILIAI